jgi:hypothetical protein
VYVANGGDGSVRIFRGEELTPGSRIELGDDADNVRVDLQTNAVYVGYGNGALAMIDPLLGRKSADIALKAHPEAFQLAGSGDRIFVNLPKTRSIAVIDRQSGKQSTTWPLDAGGNFPMALDEEAGHVLIVFRSPAKFAVLAMDRGSVVVERDTCGDADDLFFDRKRRRIYVSCGDGNIDVFDAGAKEYPRIARVKTAPGARTSLFIPAMDILTVAVPASTGEQPAIWVFHPTP